MGLGSPHGLQPGCRAAAAGRACVADHVPGSAARSGILRSVRSDPKDPESIESCLERARRGPAELRARCLGLKEEDTRRKPGVGKLSIVEHVCHMLDMERDVFGERLRRVLDEDNPRLAPVKQDHYVEEERWRGRTFAELLDEWEKLRSANIARVEATVAADWSRPVQHPDLGKATFADVVARWSRHDVEHLRQIEIIARNCAERNLSA